jgi:hypothetical protein
MAGAAGTGKTTTIEGTPEVQELAQKADLALDGTMSDFKSAKAKIEETLAAGKRATIVMVHRQMNEAFDDGVVKRALKPTDGRIVSIAAQIKGHENVIPTIGKLEADYKGNPNVEFHYIDNSLGLGNQRISSFEELSKKAKITEAQKNDIYESTERLRQEGKLTEGQYRAFTD